MEERGYRIKVPEEEEPDKDSEVFYNKKMLLNRDLSYLAGKVFSEKIDPDVFTSCDPLAASGIRGFRYSEFSDKIVLNDSKPSAYESINEGLKMNKLEAEVHNKDANILLTEKRNRSHFVDLDPFGSFVNFLDSAARSMNYQSFIGVTATDNAVAAGTYKKTCMRRYSAKPIKESFMHETGLRIYIKEVFENMSRYDKCFDPKICFHERHYSRVMGRVTESKKRTNKNLENIGYMTFCPDCRWRKLDRKQECSNCGNEKIRYAGPMWTGKIIDQRFTSKMLEETPEEWEETREFLEMLDSEAEIITPFYDIHKLGSNMGISVPKREKVLDAIENKGYPVSRTHLASNGFRTDAPIEDIKEIIRSAK